MGGRCIALFSVNVLPITKRCKREGSYLPYTCHKDWDWEVFAFVEVANTQKCARPGLLRAEMEVKAISG